MRALLVAILLFSGPAWADGPFAGGATLAGPETLSNKTISSPTISGTETITGHVVSNGTALVSGDLVFGTGAGTSPTLTSITGDDHRFTTAFSAGTSPTGGGVVFTLTFKSAYSVAPQCLVAAANTQGGSKITNVFVTTTTTTLVFTSTVTGLSASAAYAFNFLCIG